MGRPSLFHDPLRGFAPELLEPVVLARVGREDVDDHVEVVHEDPARLGQAFDAAGQQAVVLLHVLVDAVVDRLGLAVGAAGGDHEVVRVAEDAAQVELDDVDRLLVRRVPGDPLRETLQKALRMGKSSMEETPLGKVFLTVHVPPTRLVVIGAVHISQALAPIAALLGYDVTIVDPRTAFASAERFPDVKVIAEWPDKALPPLGVDRYTAFVALTHDPKVDDPALLHALERNCFYIGALGSRKTHGRRVERLKQQGASDEKLARIHAPIGLPIGAVSPPEIAVAIMGEITSRLRLTAEGKR